MKKYFLLLMVIVLAAITGYSQAPGIFNYQGVARNSVGSVLPNKTITLRLTIHDGSATGSTVYQETRTVTTNPFGLFNVQVGSPGANNVTGTILTVNWALGNKYIQVEIDPAGGSSFINIGTAQLASVPYALNAAGAPPIGPAGGSLSGNYPNPIVANGAILQNMIALGVTLPPSGPAGGSLTGTYPNPLIASGAVIQTMIAAGVTLPPNGPAGGSLSGTYPNPVIANGAVIQTMIAAGVTLPPNGPAGGSLSGTYPNPVIANGAVTQSMIAAGVTFPPNGPAGGDLSGNYPNPTVTKIQGRNINNTPPVINDVLGFDGTNWGPISLATQADNYWLLTGTSIYNANTGNIGVGTNSPSASAKLDISSTSSGILIPRMTMAQRNAIVSPTISLMIYQTNNTPGYYFFNGDGWTPLATGSITNFWSANGNDIFNNNTGNVGIGTNIPVSKFTLQTTEGYGFIHTNGDVKLGTFIGNGSGWFGTKSDHPLKFFTGDGGAQMTILQNGNIGIGVTAPAATLDVARGTAFSGTAAFRGAVYNSHFNYGVNEDTYIRGGKNGSYVIINDGALGNVGIGITTPADKLTVRTASNSYGFTHTDGTVTVGSYVSPDAGWFGTKSNHPLHFFANDGSAAMTIYPGGAVSVNGGPGVLTLSPLTIHSSITLKKFSEWNIASVDNAHLLFSLDGVVEAYVSTVGDWIQLSDISLKENVLPYKSVLSDIKNLKVSTYRYKSNAPDSRSFGLIAQNVAQYFPEIVSETQDKDGNKLLGIAYSKTGVIALKAIQEQQLIIENQQQQIDQLVKRIEALEKIIHQ